MVRAPLHFHGRIPVPEVAPLTYRDGVSQLELVYELSQYLKKILHPSLQSTVNQVVADAERLLSDATAQYVDGLQEFQRIHDAFMSDVNAHLIALNDTALSDVLDDETSITHQSAINLISRRISTDMGIGTMSLFPPQPSDLDDTERMQRAIDYCAEHRLPFTTVGDMYYTGQYLLRQVFITEGVTSVDFGGMLMKRPNLKNEPYNMTVEQRKWTRMFTVRYDGDDDMQPLTIQNAVLDGNATENWSDPNNPGYEQEQASLMFVTGAAERPGKAVVNLTNISTRDCTSDGVHIHRDAIATIQNLRSYDCFRGGLTITGGGSVVQAQNLVLEASSESMHDGFDVEIDSAGFNGNRASHIIIDGVIMDYDFDVAASNGTRVHINNVMMREHTWNIGASPGGSVTVTNSKLIRGTSGNRLMLRNGGNVMFQNVEFHAVEDDGCVRTQLFASSLSDSDATVVFDNCTFDNGSYGVAAGRGYWAHMVFDGCTFTNRVNGIAIGAPFSNVGFQPGTVTIRGCTFNNPGYWLQYPGNNTGIARISDISVINPDNEGVRFSSPTVVWLNNPTFEHGQDTSVSLGGSPTYLGERTLL